MIPPRRRRQFFSDYPEGTSLLKLDNPNVPGVTGNTVFAVVQFENCTRDRSGASRALVMPSAIAILTLEQDPVTGTLGLVKYRTYIMSSIAHAGHWKSPLHDEVEAALDPLVRAIYNDRFGASAPAI